MIFYDDIDIISQNYTIFLVEVAIRHRDHRLLQFVTVLYINIGYSVDYRRL